MGFLCRAVCSSCFPAFEHISGDFNFPWLKSLSYQLLNRFGVEQWELEQCNLNTGNFCLSLGSLAPTVWLALGSPHLVPKEYTTMRGGCPNFVYLWMTFPSSRKEDFIMITNSLLPWKSNQISLNEGDIVQAPTRRWWVKKNNISSQVLQNFWNPIYVCGMFGCRITNMHLLAIQWIWIPGNIS